MRLADCSYDSQPVGSNYDKERVSVNTVLQHGRLCPPIVIRNEAILD